MHDFFDVEIIATIVEYAGTHDDEAGLTVSMRYRPVSKRWKSATATALQRWIEKEINDSTEMYRKFSWRRFDFSTGSWSCTENAFRCTKVCADELSPAFFASVKAIRLFQCTDASLAWVLENFPNLSSIALDAQKKNEPSLALLSSVGIRCPQVSEVALSYQSLLLEEEVLALLSGVANLRSLSLKNAPCCSDSLLQSVQQRNYKLVFLDLRGFQLRYQSNLVALLQTQDQLRSIDVSGVKNVGDRTLRTIGGTCHQLQELDVSWLVHGTEAGLIAVLEGCPGLRRLKSKHWSNRALILLPKRCPSITEITVKLDAVSLEALNSLSRCAELRYLSLEGFAFVEEVPGANDAVWNAGANLRKVESLSLRCTRVSDAGLAALGTGLGLTLTSCSLRTVSGVSALSLVQLVEACPALRHWHSSQVDSLDDAFFEGLARLPNVWETIDVECSILSTEAVSLFITSPAASQLSSLTLDMCNAVNDTLLECLATTAQCRKKLSCLTIGSAAIHDDALIHLVTHCPELGMLDIRSDDSTVDRKVTDKFIDFLLREPHALYYLNCWGCDISYRAASRFASKFPKVMFNTDHSAEELGVTKRSSRSLPQSAPLPDFDDGE